ncbi:MAG: 50S ribosomal protein L21 [Acidobacteria bacterium]|nr:50S ribosomal protein L21 [Acidobacteriota bacterium]
MYAVVRQGGRQIRVRKGETVRVDRLDAAVGDKVQLGGVLAVRQGKTLTVGRPIVAGAGVEATVLEHGKADRILVLKKKRRKHYRRKRGHRQGFTRVRIERITAGPGSAPPAES